VVAGSKVYEVDDYLGVHDPATTPRKGHGLSLGYPPVTRAVCHLLAVCCFRVMEMDMWRGIYVRRVERSEDVSEVL
jgi:hypothetical protein